MKRTFHRYHSSFNPRRRRRPGRFNRRQKSFDPSVFVKKAVEQTQKVYVPKHGFSDFPLCDQLKENIRARGYRIPTPIQDKTIPLLINNKDVIGLANTGTGKTAAFLIPLVNKVYKDRSKEVLIIAPTRELALQIEAEFKAFARGLRLFSVLCIGGTSINYQIGGLRRKPHFVIGTPGRLIDLEKRRVLCFDAYTTIVLDEVDRMLDMGFIHDMKHIISRLPKERHSLFFSATIPSKAR